ncbi:MAG: FKBP-type peptidyl-prolyl cis-trans isomerase [Parasporobacterium sp.]|nr:FKBP-type peptidyl-prolyl cis-trans isomerase [Parasporobacterium sp.]
MANNNSNGAYKQPANIKKKSKWKKKYTIWLVVIIVVILGILAIVGAGEGWFKSADMINGKLEMGSYSPLEISEDEIRVSDDTIQSYLDSIISSATTSEQITEGTAEDGDTVNIDYTGVLEGEEEPFEGGTAEGQSLTLGSGTMIDGFESQIVGHSIGETFDINVTFPEDYAGDETLSGKNAVFTITLNSKTVVNVPELTDEFVQTYTAENFDEQIDSVKELKEYYRTRLTESNKQSAILNALIEKANVIYYNEADLAALTDYNASSLAYYGSSYGLDGETLAQLYGFDSAAQYADSESKNTLRTTMTLDRVAQDKGITVSDEEMNEALQKYMENENFTGTVDEFRSQSGRAFLFLVEKTEVLMPKVLKAVEEEDVTWIPSDASGNADVAAPAESEETTVAEETSAEETSAEETSAEETEAIEESASAEETSETK